MSPSSIFLPAWSTERDIARPSHLDFRFGLASETLVLLFAQSSAPTELSLFPQTWTMAILP